MRRRAPLGPTFQELGHEVILVPPQHVKPFVRGGKSDPRDALAICEAASRPGLHPVPIKALTQQDPQSLHRVRQQQVHHSTGIANQLRGIAHEYGACFPIGLKRLCREFPDALEDAENGLTDTARELLARRFSVLLVVRDEMKCTSKRIAVLAEELPPWPTRMRASPGTSWPTMRTMTPERHLVRPEPHATESARPMRKRSTTLGEPERGQR